MPDRGPWFVVTVTAVLPEEVAGALRALPGVDVVSIVAVGNAHVIETKNASGSVVDRPRGGFVLPLEVHGIDPQTHRPFVPPDVATLLDGLDADEILLGATSAAIRSIGTGGSLTLEDGTVLRVAGVVDDRWIGSAEMVTTLPDPAALGADRNRYAIVRFDGPAHELAVGLAGALQGVTDAAVRVVAEDDVPVLRLANAVQPQVAIKERFGEFAYQVSGRGTVEIDPDWVAENIVTERLPLIGSVTCHRDFIEMLRGVMEHLRDSGNGNLIGPGSDSGCWNARFIAGRRDLSRHAWGMAMDINWGNDPDGPRSPVAPALLEAMEAAGIGSGHLWTNPDPGHFEWLTDVVADA